MIYVLIGFIIVCISYFLYKAYKNTQDIQINKINILPDSTKQFPSLSILHLSDLHLENISLTPSQLASKLKDESVDIVALTGDFLDRKRSIPKLLPYLDVLQDMKPAYGIYAVLGNHDYVLKPEDLAELMTVLQEHDIHVLQNESETISVHGQLLNIVGIDDDSTNRSDVTLAYQDVQEGTGTTVVLTHDPNVVLHMQGYRFDFLMAGHFHGGQICYPKAYHLAKMGRLAKQNVIKGLHMHHETPFYISEGLGQTGLNIRIGSRPEITFHQIPLSHSKRASFKRLNSSAAGSST
ncbi:metallophosphoesterase [Lentibacillus salicampi]|uniref:Metallophosphoesterase n=1 Tax=Lentibacillus salicampi TaxID=175306 RepID=A0A4Y9ABN2_9BACI|nr:metallophosphoesterase [Lentibacillus salicampi]TFJ93319.1 metallophosphoesterase [Lentibacillus salicampi]